MAGVLGIVQAISKNSNRLLKRKEKNRSFGTQYLVDHPEFRDYAERQAKT